MDIWADIKRTFIEGSVLTRLIYVNLGVFLVVKLTGVLFFLVNQQFSLIEWLAVPSDPDFLIRRFWTPVSYMFLHAGFLHLLFNILGLYWFGKLFLYHFEGDKLLSVYLMGGIAGAFFYIVAFNVFPAFSPVNAVLLGASASVFAILVAVAVYDPLREIHLFFIGRFPLKYVAAFYVLLSIIGISTSNPGGNLAHLGGAAWGWFYIVQLGKGNDYGAAIVKWLDKIAEWFKPKSRLNVTFKQPPRDDYEYNRQQNMRQEEINRILDKIAESGYDSLTKKEKEMLFKQGKK
ncbi:MAG: rhomboid family intramembrane serine protease [Prolixibacteraceae bacterium]|jgi:membrane associated rhomboid family serine protease|nr:rhomboid family intramembrane serine protease [Prolixibacteraceae bacterium]MDD4755359.1 rhomboid family intramembrane serine protease [Prolixibacteraceae bacterium]NLO02899.1 rhomboid family intramembrane serine protease [Bacteroidales bacterium]